MAKWGIQYQINAENAFSVRIVIALQNACAERVQQMLRVYWLFLGEVYYPGGGMYDYGGNYPDVDSAKLAADSMKCVWAQVVEVENGKPVRLWQRTWGTLWLELEVETKRIVFANTH